MILVLTEEESWTERAIEGTTGDQNLHQGGNEFHSFEYPVRPSSYVNKGRRDANLAR